MATSSLDFMLARVPAIFSTFYGYTAAVVLFILAYRILRNKSHPPFPPGPKGLPLIGNALDMPVHDEWKTYSAWAKKYGPIVSLNVLGQRMVILNSNDLCKDLLESRSASYMGRPHSTFLEMMGYASWLVGILPPNQQWMKCRKQMAFNLNPQAVQKWRFYHIFEAHRLLAKLLDSPDSFFHHVDRAVAGDLLLVVYGHQLPADGQDDFVDLQEKAVVDTGRALSRGAFMFDVLPSLRYIPEWVPGANFQRQRKEAYATGQKILHEPLEIIREQMAKGTAPPSYISNLLEGGHEEFVIKQTSGTAYTAAIGGSKAVIFGAMIAMMEYPETQRRAQQEIDNVTGGTRLPDFKDRDSLPYIKAFVKEIFRWITPAPIGLPRLVTQDDVVEGYSIPAGTVVMTNTWHILHDENNFPNAMDFIPERHLDEKGNCPDPIPEGFGYGRRVCPGRYLIEEFAWISIVSLLATFEIKKPLDREGQEIKQEIQYSGGVVRCPLSFKASIKPRSSITENMIRVVNESLTCFP